MPRVDGFQFLSAIRANEKTKSIPFILLSARAGEEAAIEGFKAGAGTLCVLFCEIDMSFVFGVALFACRLIYVNSESFEWVVFSSLHQQPLLLRS